MDLDPVLLSRIQFAFVISFHIIFPAFTIGLAAWLATIEGMRLATNNSVYRRVFDRSAVRAQNRYRGIRRIVGEAVAALIPFLYEVLG